MFDSQEISRVSSNLSLRLSPQRKYRPEITSCPTCCCCPCKCCHSCHCCPCTCFLHSPSRLRYNSPFKSFEKDPLGSTNFKSDYQTTKKKYIAYEQNQFNDFLKKLMGIEGEIEKLKIDLSLNPDFNCEDAFRIFELNGRGFINQCDLKCGLNLLGIYPTEHEVRLLMKRFDLQNQGFLNYADFFDMLVPYEKDYRNMVENRLPNSCCPCRCPDIFCCGTLCALKNVFNLIIELENDINNNRRLFGTLRLKLREIFRLLDYPNRGFFSNNDLIVYLQKNGIFITNKLADLLFIRLDRSRSGNVFYKDVEDELQTLY
jgi:Ca2+-binding EF-hand superfamily protein